MVMYKPGAFIRCFAANTISPFGLGVFAIDDKLEKVFCRRHVKKIRTPVPQTPPFQTFWGLLSSYVGLSLQQAGRDQWFVVHFTSICLCSQNDGDQRCWRFFLCDILVAPLAPLHTPTLSVFSLHLSLSDLLETRRLLQYLPQLLWCRGIDQP
jgi:hypothetical protein